MTVMEQRRVMLERWGYDGKMDSWNKNRPFFQQLCLHDIFSVSFVMGPVYTIYSLQPKSFMFELLFSVCSNRHSSNQSNWVKSFCSCWIIPSISFTLCNAYLWILYFKIIEKQNFNHVLILKREDQ